MGKENDIIFKLKETLEELEITRNKLAVESKVRPGTIADMVNGNVKAVQLETLVNILNALNRIASEKGIEKRYDINDVFIYDLTEKENDLN